MYIVYGADGPPKYIRARLYTYHFTAPGSAEWWVREEQGEYLPALSRDHQQLRDILTRCYYAVLILELSTNLREASL